MKSAAKWIGVGLLILCALIATIYGGALLWVQFHAPYLLLPPRQFACLDTPVTSRWPTQRIGDFRLSVPLDMQRVTIKKPLPNLHAIWKSDKSGLVILLGTNIFDSTYQQMQQYPWPMGRDSYDFATRFRNNRHNLLFAILKVIMSFSPDARMDNYSCGPWTGIVHSATQEGRRVQEYSLWNLATGKTIGLTFRSRLNTLDETTMNRVLTTLQQS